ncbi:MAG: ABC transporter substrate-binding protein [Candidatus Thermoplasmatota archaeon]|jgi:trehalose transport system substrate-binding protein|nr:ABC transporter substrate-binding protein [Candidatus Thermoplasmatota archaeon]
MEKPVEPKKGNKNLLIGIIAVAIVVVLVGTFVGLDYKNLVAPSTSTSNQQLYVYTGVSGPANSEHLLGGCVIAEMKGGSAPPASAQLMAYLMNPLVQKNCEAATGFIPVDKGSYTSTPSSSVPSIYSPSNATVTVSYYTSMSAADQSYVSGVISNFEKTYPNINVQVSFITASSIVEEVSSLVTSNSRANVVMTIDNLDVGVLFYDGYLARINPTTITAGEGTISTITNLNNYETQVFGGVYFLTQLVNIPLVWVDYTALKNAGISQVPTTYTQLMTDAKTLDKKYGQGMINFQGHGGASTPTEMYQWMVQFGGNPMLFNDTGDIQAMEYIYNLSAYFSPDYKTSYWATYTGLASNTYSMMYYQWPGSVNLTKLGMKMYSSNDTVANTSLAAINGGVFLRSPVSWISEWNTIMDKAWVKIIESGSVTSYTQIPALMTHYNTDMYNYLVEFYSQSVANNYEAGMYAPVEGS